jgi:hypothetical protein
MREVISIEQDPVTVTISVDDGETITVISQQEATDTITVDVGGVGERGPAGAAATTAYVDFIVPSVSWHVMHNLGHKPKVTVYDSSGSEVLATVSHVSNNDFFVYFTNPQVGSVSYI